MAVPVVPSGEHHIQIFFQAPLSLKFEQSIVSRHA